ncbi:hypothetical protein FOCC_FOCC000358 [Frankliniella occidentalis]|uniref:Uncharacterized protein LOC113210374 isoform X1 n=2 Tax=Frankliniella occidentalis TaxID=133901 RepID=A0A6J1STF3_FRAOC|nr:uncharacterized protein LOC113210374 isoform X1 [Frankliniella occidentalis]XP_026284135.2 uncharacterized protein LOC113210374 isoform X1 [Frankliniella occidentalis]KAE8753012.1 hypothetical protein FOCC_FOCC000358 [Frankliniella occidentalis]
MTLQAASKQFGAVVTASSAPKHESLGRAPPQLKDGVHTFLSLAKMHPELHPAVLAAILAQPASERQALLQAASGAAQQPCSPPASQQAKGANGLTLTPSSDCSDDVWEDAVESLDRDPKSQARPASAGTPSGTAPSVPMASVVEDAPSELQRLEQEAADCHRAWQQSRQLVHWTRYNDCRNRMAQLKRRNSEDPDTPDSRFAQLQAQREVHERRLVELAKRRERLRWSRRYHEQTRAHHTQLAQAQLQERLRELEERAQLRRLQHLQRLQQLVSELSIMDQEDMEERQRSTTTRRKIDAPKPVDSSVDEFTHVWDDFSHWEKMVSDDVKENEDPADASTVPSQSPVGTRRPDVPMLANQPDLIPVLPPVPGQAGPWRTTRSSSCSSISSGGQRRSPDSGFEERKKWFEEALLSWHAQDDEEHFGTSLYPSSYVRGRAQDRAGERAPQWSQAAWSAWQGPSYTIH